MSTEEKAIDQYSHGTTHFIRREMDEEGIDREERKREYNRLAQREFRRRRKEHLKSLEQAQKERTSEQSGEIERLRLQNAELRRENDALKAQIYGLTNNSQLAQMPSSVPSNHLQHHSYPDSPSISSTIDSISGTGSPPASMASEMIPMSTLSLTSAGIPSQYNENLMMSYFPNQRYSMVTSSSVRHNAKSSPESSDFGSPQPQPTTMGPSTPVQYLNVNQRPVSHLQSGAIRQNYRVVAPPDRTNESVNSSRRERQYQVFNSFPPGYLPT